MNCDKQFAQKQLRNKMYYMVSNWGEKKKKPEKNYCNVFEPVKAPELQHFPLNS